MFKTNRNLLLFFLFFFIAGMNLAWSQSHQMLDIPGTWTRHGDACDGEKIVIQAGNTPSGIARVSASHRCNGFSEKWSSNAPPVWISSDTIRYNYNIYSPEHPEWSKTGTNTIRFESSNKAYVSYGSGGFWISKDKDRIKLNIVGIWIRHGDACEGEKIVIQAGNTPSGIARVSASHRCNGFSEKWSSNAPPVWISSDTIRYNYNIHSPEHPEWSKTGTNTIRFESSNKAYVSYGSGGFWISR